MTRFCIPSGTNNFINGIVANYSALPTASEHTGEIWITLAGEGVYVINRKSAGLYYSNGSSWGRLGNIPAYFDTTNFKLNDNSAPTKVMDVDLTNITAGNTRTLTMSDYDQDLTNPLFDYIDFDTSVSATCQEARLLWDDDDGTLKVGMPGGNVCLQVGQEGLVRVRNTSGTDIKNGNLVYTTGASGQKPLIDLADNTDSDKIDILGMATEDIDNNANGYVALWGTVRGDTAQPINTSSYAPGTKLYLNTAGGWTNTHPANASHAVLIIGVVVNQHASEGEINLDVHPFTIGNNYNGTLRQSIINKNTGNAAGSSFTAVNDQGYRTSLSIFGNSHATLSNVAGLYNEGYGDTAYVTDGNKDHAWYTDPTDSHDFSALSYERMRLKADGELQILKNISVGTDSPSGGFSGTGDIYATSGIKAMEGLYSEAVAYGAGLEVADNSLAVTYTNVAFGDATLTASSQLITDSHGSFNDTYIGQFLKVVTATAGGSPGQYVGATGEIIGVPSSTTLVISFGSAGGDTIIDATAMSFVVYPEPVCYISDNGDTHFCIGVNEDASFKVCTDISNNEHAVHFVTKSGVNSNAALHIEHDVNGNSDCSTIELGTDVTGMDSIDDITTILNVIIDNAGATAGDVHALDVAVSDPTNTDLEVEAVATHEGVDVIGQYLGDPAALDAGFEYDASGTSYTDRTTAFNSAGTDVEIFTADNDAILLASATKFDEVNVLLATNSSQSINPIFEYIEDDGSWTVFTPADDTDGFTGNGTIRYDSSTLTDWGQRTVNEVTGAAGAVDYYWIRITRTRNNIVTPPVEDTIKVTALGTKLGWGKHGAVNVKSLAVIDGITAPSAISGQAIIYVDTADGDLKCRFGNGFTATIASDS